MTEEETDWKFYNASIDALNDSIFKVEKDYSNTLNTMLSLKEKVGVLQEFVDVKEGEYYIEIHGATDDVGKPFYKNDELRKIELKDRLRDVPQYQEVKKAQQELSSGELKLELVKQQLVILMQEKEYRIKFGVKE